VTSNGIPILSKIPLLGRLFELNTVNHVKQNLLIFLKPVVLKDQPTAAKYSRKQYQSVRLRELSKAGSDSPTFEKMEPVLPRLARAKRVTLPQPFSDDPHGQH
jgi:general secretion pathway protein D